MKRLSLAGALPALIALTAWAHASGIAEGPYLMNVTPTSVTVCWVTDSATTGRVYAISRVVDPPNTGALPTAASGQDSANTRYHRVKLSGLKAHTPYSYVVEGDDRHTSGTFITAAPKKQPFHFVAYGDNRTQPDKHAAVIARMMQFHPDFVVNTGDQVANGSNESQWAEFFKVAEPMLRDTPYYPELGNHEGEASPYFRYFDLPRDYSFDYGNAHFVGLDSNRPESEHKAQEEWLRKDLAAHQEATWRIVFFHHTPYTCVLIPMRRTEAEKLRARLVPIFKEGRVQLVINGHDHGYQRHEADGITYVVTGGGGAPLYDFKADTLYVKVARSAYHDCEINVNGPDLSLRAIEPNGTVIDQFKVTADDRPQTTDRRRPVVRRRSSVVGRPR